MPNSSKDIGQVDICITIFVSTPVEKKRRSSGNFYTTSLRNLLCQACYICHHMQTHFDESVWMSCSHCIVNLSAPAGCFLAMTAFYPDWFVGMRLHAAASITLLSIYKIVLAFMYIGAG